MLSLLLRKRTVSTKAALKLLDDANAAIHYNREILQTALEHVSEGIAVFDKDLQLICWNRQFGEILDKSGYGRRVLRYELYDKSGALVFTSGLSGLQLDDNLATLLASPADESPKVALYQSSAGGEPSNFAAMTLPLALNGEPRGTLVVYLDQSDQAAVLSRYFNLVAAITLLLLSAGIAVPGAFAWMRERQRRKAEEQLRFLEEHDALTGLANRKAFGEALEQAMERMHQERTHIAVLCLDIDKFKDINEAADHSGGDQVLRDIGGRIKGTLREADLIARLGADEFAIALVDITNLGDVMAFIQYSRQFTMPIIQTASIMNVLQSATASAERVFELLDTPEEAPDTRQPQRLTSVQGRVVRVVEPG